MRCKYLIDGYNLMYALEMLPLSIPADKLETARQQLLRLVAAGHAGEAPLITIVFDATHSPPGTKAYGSYRGVRIRFAAGYQDADSMIMEMVDNHPNPTEITVVSNDRWVQKSIRSSRAKPMSCQDYFKKLQRLLQTEAQEEEIEPEKIDILTEAEKRYWLEKFKHLEDDPLMKDLHKLSDPFDMGDIQKL